MSRLPSGITTPGWLTALKSLFEGWSHVTGGENKQ